MPLFHSNAVMAGWAPALAAGATSRSARSSPRRGFLADVRRFGATYVNYVGKPLTYVLATPELPTTPTTRCGSPSATRPATATSPRSRSASAARSSTGSARPRTPSSSPRPGHAAGLARRAARRRRRARPGDRQECPRAEFDENGRVAQPRRGAGELVNTTGRRPVRRLLQRRGGDRRADARRDVLERRPRLPRRRRLRLLRRPHRRLAPRRRREPRRRPDRADPAPLPRRSPRPRSTPSPTTSATSWWPRSCSGATWTLSAELEAFLATQPDLAPSRGRATSGRSTRSPAPRPTRCSSASSGRGLADDGGDLMVRDERGTAYAAG